VLGRLFKTCAEFETFLLLSEVSALWQFCRQ